MFTPIKQNIYRMEAGDGGGAPMKYMKYKISDITESVHYDLEDVM